MSRPGESSATVRRVCRRIGALGEAGLQSRVQKGVCAVQNGIRIRIVSLAVVVGIMFGLPGTEGPRKALEAAARPRFKAVAKRVSIIEEGDSRLACALPRTIEQQDQRHYAEAMAAQGKPGTRLAGVA